MFSCNRVFSPFSAHFIYMFFLSVPSTEAGGCEVSSEHEPHMSRGGITAEMQVCVRVRVVYIILWVRYMK